MIKIVIFRRWIVREAAENLAVRLRFVSVRPLLLHSLSVDGQVGLAVRVRGPDAVR